MKRRSLFLMILIVLLPISLLTWFGLRMARDEQALVHQRYRVLMEQRLQDVNRTISVRFQETERRLQKITSLDDFGLDELRAVVRREPQVTQLFVLNPDGELMYPNPADQLNGTEQSFLRQAFRMFSDRDLQNAVALAESRTSEPQVAQFNRFPQTGAPSQSRIGTSVTRGGDSLASNDIPPSRSMRGAATEVNSGGFGGGGFPQTDDEPPPPAIAMAGNDGFPGNDSFPPEMPAESAASLPSPTEPTMANEILAANAPTENESHSVSVEMDARLQSPPSQLSAPQPPATRATQAMSSATQPPSPADQSTAQNDNAAPEVQAAARQMPSPATDSAATETAQGVSQTPKLPLANESINLRVEQSSRALRGPGSAAADASLMDAAVGSVAVNPPTDPFEVPSAAQEAMPAVTYPESRGWFVWYWDRGMNLVYWQRRPSGHIVGAALERARWIADLISWLPESIDQERDSSGFDTTFRVITSSAEPIYNWGANCELNESPYCEVPLAAPLASWRMQCFVPMAQITAGGSRSAYLGFGSGLIAFALTLCGLTWILYRDYARDMREASQQVSFVNQVSHELKTPLTNIRMYAELLERDLDQVAEEQSAKPRRRLDIINAESQRLSRLIGNVLTFARQRKKTLQSSPASLDPVTLVNQIADRFGPSLEEKAIELKLEGQPGTLMNLDADFIEQILGNLISNVEKYAATGKLLTIRTTAADRNVTIDVIDAGPGIPEKFHSSVFEPFERLNNDLRASSGTGIGLSIARDLARIHGGDVTLEPSASGCWFRARLASI